MEMKRKSNTVKKERCPICKRKKLEKIPPAFYITDNRDWWGCLNCGHAFFKESLTND